MTFDPNPVMDRALRVILPLILGVSVGLSLPRRAENRVIDLVRHGKDCTEADIIALRDMALRLAGRTE